MKILRGSGYVASPSPSCSAKTDNSVSPCRRNASFNAQRKVSRTNIEDCFLNFFSCFLVKSPSKQKSTVDSNVDVFRKALDFAENLAQRCATLENHTVSKGQRKKRFVRLLLPTDLFRRPVGVYASFQPHSARRPSVRLL